MTYHYLSMQLRELFDAYCIALSLRDMVSVRARLMHFVWRARRLNCPPLAAVAWQAAALLERDIQKVAP